VRAGGASYQEEIDDTVVQRNARAQAAQVTHTHHDRVLQATHMMDDATHWRTQERTHSAMLISCPTHTFLRSHRAAHTRVRATANAHTTPNAQTNGEGSAAAAPQRQRTAVFRDG
jgi:hypothetical protein